MITEFITDVATVICFVAFYSALFWLLWTKGVKGCFQTLDKFGLRLINGPAKEPDCLNMHLAAEAEIEIYDSVISPDIERHLAEGCSVYPKPVKQPKPTMNFQPPRPKSQVNCEHVFISQYTLEGHVKSICDHCGKVR